MADSIHTQKSKDKIIKLMLKHIPFEGWSGETLRKAVQDAGFGKGDEHRAFRGSVKEAVAHYFDLMDREMLKELKKIDLKNMRIRDRISTAVMVRLKLLEPHQEVVQKTMKYLSHPARAGEGSCYLFRTVDHMWHAAGDQSTDFNYYTKRGLLAGVYGSTLVKWLNDTSFDHMETRAFLDRRIENIMMIPKAKEGLKAVCAFFGKSFGFGAKTDSKK